MYHLPRVQLITPDDGHRRCPKHVEFRDKIRFWMPVVSCWLHTREKIDKVAVRILLKADSESEGTNYVFFHLWVTFPDFLFQS